MRVADYIAGRLKDLGVRTVFLVSGGGMMHLIDAIPRAGLRYVCNHHEQASAMAAEGYARESGGLGVCYATSGPGATNVLTGLVGAWQDSSPVLFLTGQSNVHQSIRGTGMQGLRQFGTFEVDIVPIVQSVTKYAAFLADPAMVRFHLEKALWLAQNGRPGPVLLDIPLNVQGAPIEPDALTGFPEPQEAAADCSQGIAQMMEKLATASRPLLLIGNGVRGAGEEAVQMLRELVSRLGIPVVTTQLGKDVLPYDYPLFTGHPGVKGDRAGNFAVQDCDVLLTLGTSLHAQTTGYDQKQFATKAFKIEVDTDEAILHRQRGFVDLQIHSDVRSFLRQLSAASAAWDSAPFASWRDTCAGWKKDFAVMKEPHIIEDAGPVNLYDVADTLSDVLTGEETVITDAGCSFYVMGQAFRLKGSERYIVSGAMGAMGYAVPAGIGVCAASPKKTAVCVTGDGALQVNMQELQTLKHENANLKIFIINNDGYASIRSTQRSFFAGAYVGSDRGSGLTMPSLEKIADAYGLTYVSCPDRKHLRAAMEKALSTDGPVLCDIICQTDQQIIPAVSSVRLPDGRMQSKGLEEMFPFLEQKQVATAETQKMDG